MGNAQNKEKDPKDTAREPTPRADGRALVEVGG